MTGRGEFLRPDLLKPARRSACRFVSTG
jgi:hypothetical protein